MCNAWNHSIGCTCGWGGEGARGGGGGQRYLPQSGLTKFTDLIRIRYRQEAPACPRFCVNGLMAGNCRDLQRKRNDRKQRIDRPPVGGLQKA